MLLLLIIIIKKDYSRKSFAFLQQTNGMKNVFLMWSKVSVK